MVRSMPHSPVVKVARWLSLAVWLSVTLSFWAYVGTGIFIGSGMADPTPSLWLSMVIFGVVGIALLGWAQGTRLLLRWARCA